MKKKLSFIFAVSGLFLAACGSNESNTEKTAWDLIEEKGEITVATSGTLFPTSYYGDDNELTGYEIEIVKAVAEKLDVDVSFTEMGVDGILTAVQSGQADLAANGFDITDARKEDYLFTEPVKYSFGGLVVRSEDQSGIKSFDDWEGKKAAGGATTTYMGIARSLGAEPITYDNATNDVFFRDVASGRTDFIPNDYYVSNVAVQFYKDLGVEMHELKYNPSSQAFVLNDSDESVKEKFDAALSELREEGVLKDLSAEFFGGENVSEPLDNLDDLPVFQPED